MNSLKKLKKLSFKKSPKNSVAVVLTLLVISEIGFDEEKVNSLKMWINTICIRKNVKNTRSTFQGTKRRTILNVTKLILKINSI